MYKQKKVINKVLYYLVLENSEYLFIELNKETLKIKCEEFECDIESDLIGRFFIWEEGIIVSDADTKLISVIKKGKIIEQISGHIQGLNNDFLIANTRDESGRYLNVYDNKLKLNYKIKLTIGVYRFTNENYFVFSETLKSRYLNFLNLKNYEIKTISFAENKWFSTDEDDTKEYEGKIFQIIGEWNNQLLVHIGRYRLIALNIDTGEELWRIENFLGNLSSDKTIHFSRGTQTITKLVLDEADNAIYLFARKHLIKINLKEKITSVIKDYHKDTGFNWDFNYIRLNGDFISFSASEGFKFPNYFGVIDKQSKEILWSTKCNGGAYMVEAPQINNNKLYVRDSKNTLYVYEKEEVVS